MTSALRDLRCAGSTGLLFVSGWLGDVHDWEAVRDRLANFATGAYTPAGLSTVSPADGGWSFDRGRDEADPVAAAAVQDEILGRADSVASPNHLVEALESLWSVDITPGLPSIRCPVLLISGERDRAVSPEVTRLMASRIPRCEVDVIEGAGHMPYVTAAGAVSRSITRFMKRLGGEA